MTTTLLLLYPALAHAQGGVPLWTNQNQASSFAGIVADKSGNVFVNGTGIIIKYSNDGLPLWTNLGGVAAAVDTSDNVFVNSWNDIIAYSSAGVPLWTNSASGYAIAVDSSGNVFVEGGSVTTAYSNAGVPLWTNHHPAISGSGTYKIAVSSNGKVFVVGSSWNGSNYDYATIAYSNAGVPLWTNRYNGGGGRDNGITGIAVDRNDNVFVTGAGSGYYATIKYSGAGVPLWTNRYNNGPWTPSDGANAIVVDGEGNVLVTGHSLGGVGYEDYATIKYSTAGVPLWTNRYDGPGQYSDWANAIAVDSAGNVFVTGQSSYNLPGSPRPADYATIAYSNEGVPLWTNLYNASDSVLCSARAIAVDRLGNVFVTGSSTDSNWKYHGTTIKYSSSVPPPIYLDFQELNNELVLSWTNAGFTLQTAPTLTGPYTNLPAATSPYTNPLTAPQQFFRLMRN